MRHYWYDFGSRSLFSFIFIIRNTNEFRNSKHVCSFQYTIGEIKWSEFKIKMFTKSGCNDIKINMLECEVNIN